jgi:hypothetical protein
MRSRPSDLRNNSRLTLFVSVQQRVVLSTKAGLQLALAPLAAIKRGTHSLSNL